MADRPVAGSGGFGRGATHEPAAHERDLGACVLTLTCADWTLTPSLVSWRLTGEGVAAEIGGWAPGTDGVRVSGTLVVRLLPGMDELTVIVQDLLHSLVSAGRTILREPLTGLRPAVGTALTGLTDGLRHLVSAVWADEATPVVVDVTLATGTGGEHSRTFRFPAELELREPPDVAGPVEIGLRLRIRAPMTEPGP